MPHFGVGLEYALHVLTQLARLALDKPPSAQALAEFQGVPPAYLAKIMTRMEKAGLVVAIEGKGGGYRLARPAEEISFLDVADAVEGRKKLFECTEVRQRCVLYRNSCPPGLSASICAIHAVMLAAEKRMHAQLAATRLSDVVRPLSARMPAQLTAKALTWFADHPTATRPQRSSPRGSKRKRAV